MGVDSAAVYSCDHFHKSFTRHKAISDSDARRLDESLVNFNPFPRPVDLILWQTSRGQNFYPPFLRLSSE
jgi:hypothetical protein